MGKLTRIINVRRGTYELVLPRLPKEYYLKNVFINNVKAQEEYDYDLKNVLREDGIPDRIIFTHEFQFDSIIELMFEWEGQNG